MVEPQRRYVALAPCGRVWALSKGTTAVREWRDGGWQVGQLAVQELEDRERLCQPCLKAGRCLNPPIPVRITGCWCA